MLRPTKTRAPIYLFCVSTGFVRWVLQTSIHVPARQSQALPSNRMKSPPPPPPCTPIRTGERCAVSVRKPPYAHPFRHGRAMVVVSRSVIRGVGAKLLRCALR